MMGITKKHTDFIFFIFNITLFYYVFSYALNYDRTYDDFMLTNKFFKSPGDAKLYSSFLYADFHFYPIYFLSHELDKFITYTLSVLIKPFQITFIQKNTNFLLHIFNSYLLYELLKILFNPKNTFEKILLNLSSLIFLFHPISSQIVFNTTTRNESLALFFSLLTFIYCFKFDENNKPIYIFFIITLFFFALCSKLISVTFIAIIPLAIFLFRGQKEFKTRKFKSISIILICLVTTFLIFYYIRSNFILEYNLKFYADIKDLIVNFLTGFKFYLRGLLFPIEHIYVYADNYSQTNINLIFFISFITFLISIFFLIKKKDPFLFFVFVWLSATLILPLLFNLIESGFPLISKLAERYQYFSIPSISIFFAWMLLKSLDNKYLKKIVIFGSILICILFLMIKIDRSKVYENNTVFFYKAYENSPQNYHPYFFSVPLKDAILENNKPKYLFNLYQLFNLYPKEPEYIIQFLKHFSYIENKEGYEYFLKYYKNETTYTPELKFQLAEYFFNEEMYVAAEGVIEEIFIDFDLLLKKFKDENVMITVIKPEIDDVYFLKGLILKKQNKLEDSLGSFMMATLHNPLHATALYNSSIILKELGQYELATQHFNDAIKLNPYLRETVNNVFQENN